MHPSPGDEFINSLYSSGSDSSEPLRLIDGSKILRREGLFDFVISDVSTVEDVQVDGSMAY